MERLSFPYVHKTAENGNIAKNRKAPLGESTKNLAFCEYRIEVGKRYYHTGRGGTNKLTAERIYHE